ncbi:MAG: alpha/beta hydrolase, partial [Lachnospiraceae bacterium]|nr:alpha/beta hydrolase [Lachnospiraceae bacterium]
MNNSSFQKNTAILEDSEFHSAMTKKVEPFLAGICQSGYLDVPEGKLYYEAYCPKEEKGAIVISHGFSESIEKYKEVIYYFVSAGYRVYLADHRGHGRSLRDTRHPH